LTGRQARPPSRRQLPSARRRAKQNNKTDFVHWVKEASTEPHSKAKRAFYGYLQMSFGDVDVDKDGKINAQDFNNLCEKVACRHAPPLRLCPILGV